MTDSPPDIMRAARVASSSMRFLPYQERDAATRYFAAALLAERERNAASCDRIANSWDIYSKSHRAGARQCAEEIRSAKNV